MTHPFEMGVHRGFMIMTKMVIRLNLTKYCEPDNSLELFVYVSLCDFNFLAATKADSVCLHFLGLQIMIVFSIE